MPPDPDTDAARTELHRAIMAAFCSVLHASRLPPMTVMSLTASAVGSIYKEVAEEHRSGACPCGWHPNLCADLETLQTALAATTHVVPASDLRAVKVAGRA